MDMTTLYNEMIMEHSSHSDNRRSLIQADCRHQGHNPSCGDTLELEIRWTPDGRFVEDIAFTGQGCAISQASASMMCDLIRGKSKAEALHLVENFIGMIKRECKSRQELDELEDAIVFQNISNMPARTKCAVLAWHTLKLAL